MKQECEHVWEIYDSRKLKKYTRRRKKCKKCSDRETTYEIPAEEYNDYQDLLKASANIFDGLKTIERVISNE